MTALVRAPDRTVYRVHLGQYLGQNDGRVVNIDNGGMDLVELVQDGANGWTEQPASLLLAE
jgi:type IV pilus assembly protein PilP